MLNKIIVHGRITKDIELKRTNSGKGVTNFSVAVDRDRKNPDGERDVDFLDVVAWDKTAEFISKYFSKGSEIVLSGRLQVRTWKDEAGSSRRAAEIVVESVDFCGTKKESSVVEIEDDGSLPF